MHEAIRWSYDRLGDRERDLFRRLAVFSGGFALPAALAVGRAADITDDDVLDALISLVEKSLVLRDGDSVQSRYRLLEPLRSFAVEELIRLGEEPSRRLAAANWCLGFVEQLHEDWAVEPSAQWLRRARSELDNIRASLSWALSSRNDLVLGQRLLARGRRIWARLGHHEGWKWIEMAVERQGPQTPPGLRAEIALAQAHIALARQQFAAVLRAFEFFDEYRATFDDVTVAEAQSFAGYALTQLGQSTEGERLIAQAVSVFRSERQMQLLATGVSDLGILRLLRGELSEARLLLEEALTLFRMLGNQNGVVSVAANLAEAEYEAGDIAEAIRMCREALAMSEPGREERTCSSNLAAYLIRAGDFEEARDRARTIILATGPTVIDYQVAFAIQHLAAILVLRSPLGELAPSDAMRAALLFGFVDEWLMRDRAPRPGTESYEYNLVLERLTHTLGETRLRELLQQGRVLTDDRAHQEALRI